MSLGRDYRVLGPDQKGGLSLPEDLCPSAGTNDGRSADQVLEPKTEDS